MTRPWPGTRKAAAAVKAAEAVIRANEAALEAAAIQLEYTLIRAPFDAVVLTKNADIGDIVTPFSASAESKSAVVTIADMESLQVQADVSESSLGQVKIGQPCEIQLDALPDKRLRGAVHMIVPTGDRSKAAVMVKIRFRRPGPPHPAGDERQGIFPFQTRVQDGSKSPGPR